MASNSKMPNPKSVTDEGKRSRLISIYVDENQEEEDAEGDAEEEVAVTTQIRLAPSRPSEKLDKDVVLRRIRHRKRVNMVKNAVQSLFSSSADDSKKICLQQRPRRWVDDAFAAL